MPSIHITLKAETLFTLAGIPISNSLLTTWIVMALLIWMTFAVSSNIRMIPGSLQLIKEMLIGGIHDLFEEILHEKNKIYFSFLMTLFIFIIAMNWSGLFPGVGTIGIYKNEEKSTAGFATPVAAIKDDLKAEEKRSGESVFVPLFRSGSADLNMTFALALLTMGYIQYAGLKTLGLDYIKKFINTSDPMNFVVGILELISEFARIVSFAFRLFGNIFAGEVLLTVIAFLIPLLAPLPFLGLDLFVGLIQAMVFPLLAAVFFSMAVSHEEH